VNYNTIARVYLDLHQDGVIFAARAGHLCRRGADDKQVARARYEKLQAMVRSVFGEGQQAGLRSGEIGAAFEQSWRNGARRMVYRRDRR
jgi:DNA-binding transcriptional regulator YhcF (GntR family)